MDKVNQFLKDNFRSHVTHDGELIIDNTKRLICKDGFSISVQASHFHYCEPRRDKAWPYNEVELAFPSELDNLISDYAYECDTTNTTYAYVPIDIVNKLIEKHGGITKL